MPDNHIICIHQPDFAPYLGFFDRLLVSQHFILLDDVQFIRRGWQHRDLIKAPHGVTWLTLSLRKGEFHQAIRDVELSGDTRWIARNLNLIKECYRKTTYFHELFPRLETIYTAGYRKMIDLNRAVMDLAFDYLDISVPISYASDYDVNASSSARLVALVRAAGGGTYLAGTGSRAYLDDELFRSAGLDVMWQDFRHPVYAQQHGKFEPGLSCLDILFNCGREAAKIIRSGENA